MGKSRVKKKERKKGSRKNRVGEKERNKEKKN